MSTGGPSLQVGGARCVVVSTYHLMPGYRIAGFSGRTHPARWRRVVARGFDLRRSSGGGGAWTARAATRLGPDRRGFSVIQLHRRRVPATGDVGRLLLRPP